MAFQQHKNNDNKLRPYLSPIHIWALSLGTSIGWGSLVVTSNTYLASAGPAGSVIGVIIGGAIMLIIGRCYAYMIRCYPDAGGSYAYAKEVMGYDHGFLAAWFTILTYMAILWANLTSIPLFFRYLFGETFCFGKIYSLFGYDVYLGEALLSISFLALFALLLIRFKAMATWVMTIMVILFTVGITVCFLAGIFKLDIPIAPAYIPKGNAVVQTIGIACISPWAFIGFENISHSAEEYSFQRKKVFGILTAAVIVSTALYVFVTLLSVTAFPPEYKNWMEYIGDIGNLSGIKAIPAFYAAEHYLGSSGVVILLISLLALILTSLIGNITALSRLFYALAKDKVLPRRFAKLNRHDIPANAIILIAVISAGMTFIGRVAIGWIVDVTTIGAVIIYAFVAASAYYMAKKHGEKKEEIAGMAGLLIMIGFGVYLLMANLLTSGTMAVESYILFVIWSVIGFIFFRIVLRKDTENRFGDSVVVWIVLLSVVLFVAMVWMNQSNMNAANQAMQNVEQHFIHQGDTRYLPEFVAKELVTLRQTNAVSVVVVIVLFGLALAVVLNSYVTMKKRARLSEEKLGAVKHMVNTDPLTGVKSKRAFDDAEEKINQEIAEGMPPEFGIVVCDMNDLKQINDTLGHKAGDESIRYVCRIICEKYNHSPVYRIGGDEFAVILKGQDYERRQELLDAMKEISSRHIRTGNPVIAAGMAVFDSGRDKDVKTVFDRADANMYEQKKELKSLTAGL